MEPVFQPWPKIARLYRDVVITEKIDGTNACVVIEDDGSIYAQSRTRIITPDSDNFGFARWVEDNRQALGAALGAGRHYGEWWGRGIQRGYGLDERRFSLFNVRRHGWLNDPAAQAGNELGLRTVPVIYEGPFSTDVVENALDILRSLGSRAVPGFMKPEGIVVFHAASGTPFKVTLEGDEAPKGVQHG